MKRSIVLGTLLAIGGLSIGVSAARQGGGQTQTVQVEKLHDNLFVLRGGGGNTAVFVTADGVTVVDSKNPAGARRSSTKSKSCRRSPSRC
jgi:hypothetical protein